MKLLTPIKIGSMELKNRVVMPAMHLGYCNNGAVTDELVAFYRERAKGGVGLIEVGGCAIDEHGYGNMIKIDHDQYIPGLTQLTQAVQQQGSKIAAQLFQPGRYSYSFMMGIQPVAPSPVPSRLTRQMPRELTTEEIQGIIEKFGQSAVRAQKAGFDAVEVIASAGYLISQFLSPITNQRDDMYGGDEQRRMKFGLDVAGRVRELVGPDYPIIFRVSGNEFMPGGNNNKIIAEFCRRLEQAGVDAFNVTGGWHETMVPQITMAVPRGALVYLARGIKEAVQVPVIACNRINDPLLAEQILVDGSADLVGMARAMIADPDVVAKVASQKIDQIRKCIGCNQGCLDAVFTMRPVTCLVNPMAGRELKHQVKPAGKVKKVLVVGGGPAGLEAAKVAAERGHSVTLWEQGSKLGGQLNIAAVPPGREEFATVVKYYRSELDRLGVQVQLNQKADEQNIIDFGADAVVMATGALPITPNLPGIDEPQVVQAWDVLDGKVAIGERVVVIGGGAVGCETALYLARQGTIDADTLHFLVVNGAEDIDLLKQLATRGTKQVTLVEMQKNVGADIGLSTRWVILQDLKRYGIKVLGLAKAQAVTEQGLIVDVNGQQELIAADTIVLAAGSNAVSALCEKIKEQLPEVYMVGDAVKPRKALEAIYQGFLAGVVL